MNNQFFQQVKDSRHILRAINQPLRRKIIELLQGGEKLCVSEIQIKLKLDQSVTSQQLKILREAGILTADRQGKHIYYSLNEAKIKRINKANEAILK